MISENNDSGHGKIFESLLNPSIAIYSDSLQGFSRVGALLLGFHECKDYEKLCAVG